MKKEVPVLIVGGGGCGLSSSVFLSDLGVDHLLIERHPGTAIIPKAHIINMRSMQIMRQHGLADEFYKQGAPTKYMSPVRWKTSLAGEKEYEGRNIHEIDSWGGGELEEAYLSYSPVNYTNFPQIRLEPYLRKEAEKRAPNSIYFHHELVDWVENEDGILATIRNRDTNETVKIHAQYMIGADAGRTVGPKLGIEMEGPKNFAKMVTLFFRADLSEYVDTENLIWLPNPDADGSYVLLKPEGPTWGKHSEEWSLQMGLRPEDPDNFSKEDAVRMIQEVTKIPGFEPEIINISHWQMNGVVAEYYQKGRVFLAGDATHKHPPNNGLGLNTAFQDAHNLAWKLAAVIKGQASESLLETYEKERKPIGKRIVSRALTSFNNHGLLAMALGLSPEQTEEEREEAMNLFFSDTELGEIARARAAEIYDTQRMEFQALDVDIGSYYEEGAVVSDGTAAPRPKGMGTSHQPTTRPGHLLPHAWIQGDEGKISTLDLVNPSGGFVLITGKSDSWKSVAEEVSNQLGVKITCISIGENADFADHTGQWKEVRQINDDGAILVRPDNFVAWRTKVKVDNPNVALADVLARILKGKVLAKNK